MTSSTTLRYGILFVLVSHIVTNSTSCAAQEPRIAGIAPAVSVGIGYAYLNSEIPSAGRINQNGVASGVTTEFTRRFGIKVEASYTRTYGAFGLKHHSDVLAYLGGPVVYPIRRRRLSIYAQALVGAARITGVITESNDTFLFAKTNKLAWSLGPGVDMRLSRSSVLRIGGDYLHSTYFAPNKAIKDQGNIRVIISLVYALGKVR